MKIITKRLTFMVFVEFHCALSSATEYYVNDAQTNSDVWCIAPDATKNAGTSADAQAAAMQDVLDDFDLSGGDTIDFDNGLYGWDLSGITPGDQYRVRVSYLSDTNVYDSSEAACEILSADPKTLYINDGSTTDDAWCSAPGAYDNNGYDIVIDGGNYNASAVVENNTVYGGKGLFFSNGGGSDRYYITNRNNIVWARGSDEDGHFNWQEYFADTIPTDPGSLLRFISIQPAEDGNRVMWKSCGPEAVQYIERSDELNAASGIWEVLWTNRPQTETTNTFIDPDPPNRAKYYRIRAKRK